ncbi:hypothetical protein Q73_16410, partial [Bacillus coahuilensis m2-6]|uniref:type II secretion system protein n=1 Tax=Bacillus coahuilensis TaxID=408580 RepID=UPI00079B4B07
MKNGFTLLEMLLVVAIIGVLTVLLTVEGTDLVEGGQSVATQSDLRTLEAAVFQYELDHHQLPASGTRYTPDPVADAEWIQAVEDRLVADGHLAADYAGILPYFEEVDPVLGEYLGNKGGVSDYLVVASGAPLWEGYLLSKDVKPLGKGTRGVAVLPPNGLFLAHSPGAPSGGGGSVSFSTIETLSLGHDHSAALKSDGTLWTWGHGGYGQLGHGNSSDRNTPTQVGSDSDWVGVSL